MKFEKELYEAKKAAITAGKKAMEIYRSGFSVDYKEDESPVTIADLTANEIILSRLKEAFPNYAFLSEETKDNLSRLENDFCFIIDPIDGTKEFVNKTGEFTVNISLSHKQEIVMGVIYAPVLDELYYAVKGEGAYKVKDREYTKLSVSNRTEQLIVAESRSHKTQKQEQLYDENKDKIAKLYTVGSSLKGCFIAAGVIDVFYRFGMGTKEYDIAAMTLICEEAGAIIKDLNHEPFKFNKEDIYNRNGYYIINNEKNLFKFEHII